MYLYSILIYSRWYSFYAGEMITVSQSQSPGDLHQDPPSFDERNTKKKVIARNVNLPTPSRRERRVGRAYIILYIYEYIEYICVWSTVSQDSLYDA